MSYSSLETSEVSLLICKVEGRKSIEPYNMNKGHPRLKTGRGTHCHLQLLGYLWPAMVRRRLTERYRESVRNHADSFWKQHTCHSNTSLHFKLVFFSRAQWIRTIYHFNLSCPIDKGQIEKDWGKLGPGGGQISVTQLLKWKK